MTYCVWPRTLVFIFLTSLSILGLPTGSFAVEFVIVGPRAVGMGGAGVAVTTDSLATYWNPAGLAMTQKVDIRFQASAQGIDRLGIRETLEDIDDINDNDISAGNQARLQSLLNDLNGSSLSALAATGLYAKGYWGEHSVGINISDVGTGGSFSSTPLTAIVSGSQLDITGELQVNFLEARQIALSYAYALFEKKVALGITGKVIQGVAYKRGIDVDDSEDSFNISDELKNSKKSTRFGIDIGALVHPISWLQIGIVGKDLNKPSFKAPGGGKFKLRPQVRSGVAFIPFEATTVTFDADLTKNKTLVSGIKSRVLSLGVEQGLFDIVFLRVGALKNVEDAKSRVTPTAGLGIRLWAFQFDVGGGYDFDDRGALGSFSLAVTF
ncbi:MAG: conjugal transfer protein TraF [Nitrospirota bacterium]|nr:conjugal transfer protein TraF [Nitrospirota bacterium]